MSSTTAGSDYEEKPELSDDEEYGKPAAGGKKRKSGAGSTPSPKKTKTATKEYDSGKSPADVDVILRIIDKMVDGYNTEARKESSAEFGIPVQKLTVQWGMRIKARMIKAMKAEFEKGKSGQE